MVRLPAPVERSPSDASNVTSGGNAPVMTFSAISIEVTWSFSQVIPNQPSQGSKLFSSQPVVINQLGKMRMLSNLGSESVITLGTLFVAL